MSRGTRAIGTTSGGGQDDDGRPGGADGGRQYRGGGGGRGSLIGTPGEAYGKRVGAGDRRGHRQTAAAPNPAPLKEGRCRWQ